MSHNLKTNHSYLTRRYFFDVLNPSLMIIQAVDRQTDGFNIPFVKFFHGLSHFRQFCCTDWSIVSRVTEDQSPRTAQIFIPVLVYVCNYCYVKSSSIRMKLTRFPRVDGAVKFGNVSPKFNMITMFEIRS